MTHAKSYHGKCAMDKKGWVDFSAIKQAVSFDQVLGRYGIDWLRRSGDNLRGRCPIHEGEGQRSFHVSLSKNAFYCFSCKAKGNALDFVALMEHCDIREAALKLQEWFLGGKEAGTEPDKTPAASKPDKPEPTKPEVKPVEINPPLGFELRVDCGHEYGLSRGFEPKTLEAFGAGFCLSRGMFSGRFVIPLHDALGQLIGYAGRSIDDSEPKYLFPSNEKGFYKSRLLFSLHRLLEAKRTDEPVVVVEGFFGCIWLHQAGMASVALLGSSLSAEQEELIASHFEHVILFFDGDEAGQAATEDCLRRLSRRSFVKAIRLGDGRQPDDLAQEELHQLL